MREESPTLDQICFVLSPIGREGTETHEKFQEVLNFVIKPAVESAGLGLKVIRADDIERPGSFIKYILEYIDGSFIVIADLTQQNPNVFYELGVRHALSPRTILIAQTLEDIPSDLREYRTVIYDTSARGATLFRERIEKYLREIREDPQRPDNPVLDRLGGVVEERTQELEAEVARLNSELDTVLRTGGLPDEPSVSSTSIGRRLDRVLKIMKANKSSRRGERLAIVVNGEIYPLSYIGGHMAPSDYESFHVPRSEGNFQLYLVQADGKRISNILYIKDPGAEIHLEEELADARVLMAQLSGTGAGCTFVIVTGQDLSKAKEPLNEAFTKMKAFLASPDRDRFFLEIWDESTLRQKEQQLGIKVNLPGMG